MPIELNTVLYHRLWPRSIITPPLTEADQESLALQAIQSQRRPDRRRGLEGDDESQKVEGQGRGPQEWGRSHVLADMGGDAQEQAGGGRRQAQHHERGDKKRG